MTVEFVQARRRTASMWIAAAALALGSAAAFAEDVKVKLTGAEETPPVATSATGQGTIHIAKDKSVSGTIKTKGLEGIAAHIHVGTAPAATFPVRWGFFGTPDNDNNPDQLVVTPFATGVGGTFSSIWDLPEGNAGTTFATNLPDILAGRAYINFHTVQNGGGEIRGNFAGAIPEPSSWAMMLLGFGLVGASLRFARKRVPALAG